MGLFLPDRYVWDFWLLRRREEYHLFYLQAPRTPHDPELRHGRATVGHAVSGDLRTWRVLPDALGPGRAGEWDDRAIWTGCVVEQDGLYHFLYTGTSVDEGGRVQRIGLAVSEDLLHWERHPANPVLRADDRWYERLGDGAWPDESWRDPALWWDPADGIWYAFICARSNEGPADGRGAVALARSKDLVRWEVLPPAYAPGEFTQMEVPQLFVLDGRYYLLFTTAASWHARARRRRVGALRASLTGTFALVSDRPTDGFTLLSEDGLVADPHGRHYAGKLVWGPEGRLLFLATRHRDSSGGYAGALSDPAPVERLPGGSLGVDRRTLEGEPGGRGRRPRPS